MRRGHSQRLERTQQLNAEGSTVDVVIEQPGEHRYFCQVHPSMRGEIVAV